MEVTTTTMIGLITYCGQLCALQHFLVQTFQPWDLGHIHKFFTKEMVTDPVKGLWDMYRKHQRNGVMWTRNFNMDILWVGDFDTLHYLFNHPQVQDRFSPRLHGSNEMERKLATGQDIPGLLISEGRTWVEQRRFSLRTLRDYGFGKSSMEETIKEEVQLFTEEKQREPFDFINIATSSTCPSSMHSGMSRLAEYLSTTTQS